MVDTLNEDYTLTPADLEITRELERAFSVEKKFLASIHQPCYLKFKRDTVTIFFFGHCPFCPLPGIEYSQQGDGDSCQSATCSIGDAFFAAYKKLLEQAKILNSFELDSSRLDAVYQVISDMRLLAVAVDSLDDAMHTPSDLMDRLLYFCESDVKPFYGSREVQDNTYQVLQRYLNGKAPDHPAFLSYVREKLDFNYKCNNLYQVCGAILDYLCHYTIYDRYSSKPHKYSLRRCPRCGRYFTTADRKIIYCQHIDEQGKTCADWQEADRKKKFAQIPKNDAEELAEKIRRRLYSYRMVIKISRTDYKNDPRYSERDELYKLYTKRCKDYSQRPDFAEWIAECAARLPKSRNESYDKFKKWLLERS